VNKHEEAAHCLKELGLSEETSGISNRMITTTDFSLLALIGLLLCRLGETSVPSVTALSQTLCPGSSNYAQLHVFIWEIDEGGEGGVGQGEGVPCEEVKSFWCCILQFRSCSVPTQIKTSPVAYVNILPTVLRFNEP